LLAHREGAAGETWRRSAAPSLCVFGIEVSG
jgi:hypothetical protein